MVMFNKNTKHCILTIVFVYMYALDEDQSTFSAWVYV